MQNNCPKALERANKGIVLHTFGVQVGMGEEDMDPKSNTQKDHINIRILRKSISGIPPHIGP